MAIKIVKETPHRDVVKKIVCKSCGVTLSYTPNDIQACHGTDRGGGPDGHEWIDCPKCGKQVILRSW